MSRRRHAGTKDPFVIWRFFDNRTGQHFETASRRAVTATNGICLSATTPP
jgi:hypothetical protein